MFQDVSFSLRKNSFTALIGPTGSGKSSLLKLIKGVIPYIQKPLSLSGEIIINGVKKDPQSYFRQSIQTGYLFQDFDLQFIGSTVEKELAFQLENMGIPSQIIEERIQWFTKKFNLSSMLSKAPHTLSGGELAQVEFISTIISDPLLLLFDEPFVNLDYVAIQQLLDIFRSFHGQYTILVSTHNFIQFLDLIDTVLLIDGGQILQMDITSFLTNTDQFPWLNISNLTLKYYAKFILKTGIRD